jgi:methyl-accepting chemotaxis protein
MKPAENAPPPETPPTAPPPADPAAEADKPPEPVNPTPAEEQDRQRELIRKIEETVKGEMDLRATEMENETRTRLAGLDVETLKRIDGLRAANGRDLSAILVTLVIVFLVLAAVGIVVTHKVVGPIYRMKMLVGKIDGDHLLLQGQLRKGDELQDLFEEVQRMLDRLRDHQQSEVSTLGGLLTRIKGSTGDADREQALAELEKFRARMASVLEKK